MSMKQLQTSIEARQNYFEETLPRAIPATKFIAAAKTAIFSNDYIAKLALTDHAGVISELSKCAMDGLVPDGRQAAIVPFKGKAVYMPMAHGLKLIAESNDSVSKIDIPVLVYSNDHFEYESGDYERIIHKPDPFASKEARGDLVGCYCVAHMKDGALRRCIMGIDDIHKRRDASSAKNGPWNGPFYEEMVKKTVLKKLCKSIPSTVDLSAAFKREEDLEDMKPGEMVGAPKPKTEDYTPPEADDTVEIADHNGEVTSVTADPKSITEEIVEAINNCPVDAAKEQVIKNNLELIATLDEEFQKQINEEV